MLFPFNPQQIFGRLRKTLSHFICKNLRVRISIVVFLLFSVLTVSYFFFLVFGIDLSLIWGKLKSMLLVRSFRVLLSRLLGWEVPIFVLVFLVGLELDSSLHMRPENDSPSSKDSKEAQVSSPLGEERDAWKGNRGRHTSFAFGFKAGPPFQWKRGRYLFSLLLVFSFFTSFERSGFRVTHFFRNRFLEGKHPKSISRSGRKHKAARFESK
ncbi:hypothetical protein NitaMp158 (mitochondrion) [Nicotiana tabacum]|uniref:Uncharacterized protein n=1 Tax=Nicotiana tabacum TaxID=4097 RepID=Q5M9R7_TOBAC|nr:hypothetical protein NitaMp158 [Nicotiana tabacum]BAD83561.1 hypothetical protein [Nicotiana tabacum]